MKLLETFLSALYLSSPVGLYIRKSMPRMGILKISSVRQASNYIPLESILVVEYHFSATGLYHAYVLFLAT